MIDQAQKLRGLFAQAKSGPATVGISETGPLTKDGNACRSIAVTSGKGGVGKTSICLSLGIALSSMKKKVLILDADLGLANIHIMLGISPAKTLSHYINKECSLAETIVEGPSGIHILPGASGIESMANVEPMQLGVLQRELAALEKFYDFLLIDTAAGIGRVATEFASNADASVLVVTPEPTSFADAYAMVKVLYKKQQSPISTIVNITTSDNEGKETFDRLNALVVRFLTRPLQCLAVIPFDKQVGAAIRRQCAVTVINPHSVYTSRIQGAARILCGLPATKHRENFFSRLLNSF